MHGKGTFAWGSEGSESRPWVKPFDVCEGQWASGKMHGPGNYTHAAKNVTGRVKTDDDRAVCWPDREVAGLI